MSSSDELQGLQRDLNCLADSNRATRISALERLKKKLVLNQNLEVFDQVMPVVIKLLEDPVESCRSQAIEIIGNIWDKKPQEIAKKHILTIAANRLGANQSSMLYFIIVLFIC